MAHIQGTSLQYFVSMCIVQASSVPTTVEQGDVVKSIKRTEQFISPVKTLLANIVVWKPTWKRGLGPRRKK